MQWETYPDSNNYTDNKYRQLFYNRKNINTAEYFKKCSTSLNIILEIKNHFLILAIKVHSVYVRVGKIFKLLER